MPPIIPLTHDQSTSLMVTHSNWTHRLVDQGVLWDPSNDSTIHNLSLAQLLFYPQQHTQNPLHFVKKSLHLILFETRAFLPVNNILRLTLKFQQAIEEALIPYPSDFRQTLKNLILVFDTYGFLWPQKLILGHRIHVKKSYKVYTPDDRLMYLRVAKDDVLVKLAKERELKLHERQTHTEESLTWTIIKRNDICPIYEFLDDPWKQQIQHVIHECLYRIPIHAPIKLRNYSTNAYLSWRLNDDEQVLSLAALPMDKLMSSQYLWRFTLTRSATSPPSFAALPDLVASYQSQFLRCGSDVFLSPACDTLLSSNQSNNKCTHTSILTRSPSEGNDARIRSVGLFNPDNNNNNNRLDGMETTWKVELPGLGLGRDDDSSTDEGLNMDILIGRCRLVLHGDIIALRQVLYLCAQQNSTLVHPIVAKENALIGRSLEQCWWIELATEEDLKYHQDSYIPWSNFSSTHLLRQHKSVESLAICTDNTPFSLRRVQSFDGSLLSKSNPPKTNVEFGMQKKKMSSPPLLPTFHQPTTTTSNAADEEVGYDTNNLNHPRVQPYLRLYASKQQNTLARVWKHSSLKQVLSRFPNNSYPFK
ncbi:uncharacterized protein BX664DRAFT_344466 [Halteromyces radiatus]|uniref:uncharacterized protein n=1 Tax=Halteromyces radiatus TaxID=101107 RepID=UPI002220C3AD|nr:uncharacterized protein BX664DRAFT_344466 [Halteromyces radiatus]KAI8076360.1 hypothetical protein BX664DRAFT_344466 [Halteromyces radiatus]